MKTLTYLVSFTLLLVISMGAGANAECKTPLVDDFFKTHKSNTNLTPYTDQNNLKYMLTNKNISFVPVFVTKMTETHFKTDVFKYLKKSKQTPNRDLVLRSLITYYNSQKESLGYPNPELVLFWSELLNKNINLVFYGLDGCNVSQKSKSLSDLLVFNNIDKWIKHLEQEKVNYIIVFKELTDIYKAMDKNIFISSNYSKHVKGFNSLERYSNDELKDLLSKTKFQFIKNYFNGKTCGDQFAPYSLKRQLCVLVGE